jgi:Na+/H+ antiporter NhaD/arsenite permease-like protein
MPKLLKSMTNNIVAVTAALAAVVTSLYCAPPVETILNYIDYKTIICLFCIMGVIEACKNIRLFRITAAYLLRKFSTARKMVFALVFITFFFSMFIANDMALLTFLPFTYMTLEKTNNIKLIGFTIIMQNIAANLGGLLTPFGNPQNLYLFAYYGIESVEFLTVMLPLFLFSIIILIVCCIFVKNTPLEYRIEDFGRISAKKAALYLAMFVFAILTVFRIADYIVCFIAITALLLIFDRKALLTIDYPLLLTFVSFFIFTGNIAGISGVNEFLSGIAAKSPFFTALLSCQLISNVPTAALFSKFVPRADYKHLLWAVNIGGMGTIIASLASLISFKSFTKKYSGRGIKYLSAYTAINFALAGIFVLVYLIFGTFYF